MPEREFEVSPPEKGKSNGKVSEDKQSERRTTDHAPGLVRGEEREELLRTITVEYIARREAGERPGLIEYTTRYPDLADEFRSNVAYYELQGRGLLGELRTAEASPEYLAGLETAAADPAFQAREAALFSHIFSQLDADYEVHHAHDSADNEQNDDNEDGDDPKPPFPPQGAPLVSLFSLMKERPDRLAARLDAAFDLFDALERRMVKIPGLARKLVADVANIIERRPEDVLEYLRQSPLPSDVYYNKGVPDAPQKQDFTDWVLQSQQLNEAQREYWLQEAAHASYTEADA